MRGATLGHDAGAVDRTRARRRLAPHHAEDPLPGFRDHFSGHAASYAQYRPHYPNELFKELAARTPAGLPAWDVGTGSGQAAAALAARGLRVLASDASRNQVREARPHPDVTYAVCLAERAPLRTAAVGLVTVAQALHWFRIDAFYAEVRRVLDPSGLFAVWTYDLPRITPDVDRVVDGLYRTVEPWWPPERRHVEAGYGTLPFPFARVEIPVPAMAAEWSLDDLVGYCGTWSAVRRFRSDRGGDPVAEIRSRLEDAWAGHEDRTVRWPLTLLAGRP